MSVEPTIYFAVQLIGICAASFLAYRSFQKRRIQLGAEPTLPQYFVGRNTYWIGIVSYCSFMAVLYWLLTENWLPVEPLVTLIVQNVRSGELVKLLNGLDGNTLIPIIAAGLFFLLIAWENKFNPLLVLRDSVHDAFAIPTKAVVVYNALITSRLSAADDELRERIADRLLVPSIDQGDYEKSSATVEYKWAHNCLLFDRIQHYADQSSYSRFFHEPSLKWGPICISYNAMSEKIAVWKEAEPHYTKTVNLLKELDQLTGLLCRLLACLIVFGSTSETDTWATVKQLGGNILIDPFDDTKLNPNSYNLSLHDELLVYEEVVLDMRKSNRVERVKIPADGLVLTPNQLYLGRTTERTETGMLTYFFFSREGNPSQAGDKDVTFTTRRGPMEIKAKFSLKDMMSGGKLEL